MLTSRVLLILLMAAGSLTRSVSAFPTKQVNGLPFCEGMEAHHCSFENPNMLYQSSLVDQDDSFRKRAVMRKARGSLSKHASRICKSLKASGRKFKERLKEFTTFEESTFVPHSHGGEHGDEYNHRQHLS
ncbi:hypothetical protein FA10DRAFT_99379 [Acaromyces ingoldii]|uniref:Uncharacterized protein n=1 Tax=Acaromyces ingoldii TaxID=215250 RepID=A0A316YMI4_9BASI|nr:hypothetical protein FA10DRAFT_99379 [Acaromyces ingoldii]PWN89878.1 hypothetical protein FA10DRAFT_99379 [Acaromyces ingoldii]